jgi:hypothetical protein
MRIPPYQVLFLGKLRWPEFDCLQQPLPDKLRLLLWMVDGSERRYCLAKRWVGGQFAQPRSGTREAFREAATAEQSGDR